MQGFLWLDIPSGSMSPPCLGFENTRIETHYIRQDSSGRVISPTQRPPNNYTQHSQETDIHALAGFETTIPPRGQQQTQDLKPRGHRDLHFDVST